MMDLPVEKLGGSKMLLSGKSQRIDDFKVHVGFQKTGIGG